MESVDNQSDISLPTEDEVNAQANSRTGLFSYFKVAQVELPKFLLMGTMFGFINFIYSFMRILKDLFVNVRQDQNAIMFMKIFYVLPLSMASAFLIQWMMSKRSVSQIFNIFLITFSLCFFGIGIVFLFEDKVTPSRNLFRDIFSDHKAHQKGLSAFKYFFITLNEPVATFIFLLAELWGSLLMAYLFMSFLNETCTVRQFSRFLPPFYIIANVALLLSGLASEKFRTMRKNFNYEKNLILYASVFIIEGIVAMMTVGMKYYLETRILNKPIFRVTERAQKKQKVKVGFTEGISIMTKSKLLMSLCIIVCFYNVTFNMIESAYKAGVKAASISLKFEIGDYSMKFNTFDQYIVSISVIILNLSAFSTLVETSGWVTMGLLTPILTIVAAIILLGAALYNSGIEDLAFPWISRVFIGKPFIYGIENWGGMIFLAFLKVLKYSAFDICKEKIGMRIESSHRARFKSVYDGIFNKLGKSIGSLYGLGVISLFSTENVRKGVPFTLPIVLGLTYVWIRAVLYLASAYNRSIRNNCTVDIDLIKKDKEVPQE